MSTYGTWKNDSMTSHYKVGYHQNVSEKLMNLLGILILLVALRYNLGLVNVYNIVNLPLITKTQLIEISVPVLGICYFRFFCRVLYSSVRVFHITSQESFPPAAYPAQMKMFGMCSTYPASLYMSSQAVLLITGRLTSCITDGRGPSGLGTKKTQIFTY